MADYRQKLLEQFTTVYNQLNDKQRIAVDTIEGPVMVIAGPGTGKTQILAARIGKILLETDALPQNILCLTYTEAGVIAMRRRLQDFIGAAAYKVNIYTFHAFCNDVIQENLSLFEKNTLDPVSDLERITFFEELINAFPKNHPLKRYKGNIYYEAPHLQVLFASMKREGWTPAFLLQKIDEYLEDIKTRDEFIYKNSRKGQYTKGDYKANYYKALASMEKLRAAVNEFDRFQSIMNKHQRYDFDDMINWVIKAFQENKNLLADYQERYQYILVDEFQDTSGSQSKIVELLIQYWEAPNVFVVGDDDQSIFRFQGANVENMLHFAHEQKDHLKTVVLTHNYRSTQSILDIAHSVISNNKERLIEKLPGLSKDLIAANEQLKTLQQTPQIYVYRNVQEEMMGTALHIKSLLDQQIKPAEIAVIYKENKYGEELNRYLQLYKIPVYSKRSLNLFTHPLIKKIMSLLNYLDQEHDIPYSGDELLFEILHFDFYKIPPIEIAKLTVEANQHRFKGNPTALRQLLYEKATSPAKDLFDEGLPASLKKFSGAIEHLIADVSNVTLQQLVENLLREGGILSYVLDHPQKLQLLQYLTTFFDFVKAESNRNPLLTLSGLLQTFVRMQQEGIPLNVINTIGNEDGVNLLTAHSSKGLEYEYVFINSINATLWEKKKKTSVIFKVPDTVFSSEPEGESIEEIRRLFYVALTRAKKNLYLSYLLQDDKGKTLEQSTFIAEILEKHPLEKTSKIFSVEQLAQFQELQLSGGSPVIQHLEDDFIDGLLAKFVMNVTALNNYLDCPLKFYYQNLIRIPSGKNENTAFGSAVHFALERLFKKMQDDTQYHQFPSVDTLKNDFEWYMNRHRQSFTAASFARRMEQGFLILPEYYAHYINSWNKVVALELNINNVIVNDIPIKGKIDKLEFDGNFVNVVDYKTGNFAHAKLKLLAPSDKNPLGGDYWRQAVFYKLLIDNYEQKNWKVISTEFDFIEPDDQQKFIKEKVHIQPDHLEIVKEQITTTWNRIQQKDFYTGCGKPDCHWCNFVKDNDIHELLLEQQDQESV